MKFGPVLVEKAEGAVLAHSLALEGRRLKKGCVLSADDIAAIRSAGLAEVTVAVLDESDLTEDEAARRIATSLTPNPERDGLTIAAPFTGRANAFAARDGLLEVDVDAVARLNAIDPAITLATLHNFARVSLRQMIATAKIIPYGAPSTAVVTAEAVSNRPLMRVHPFKMASARLILTRTPGMKTSVLEKGAEAVKARLRGLGIAEVVEAIVEHAVPPLAKAIVATREEMTLVLTGSATSDSRDVGPAALVAAGGSLTRFGMPVDPGNLLFLGDLQSRTVIGLPGCARSPKLNGADWVMERVAAGVSVGAEDIAAMGVGGLLKEISSRPEPRVGGAATPKRPIVGAILLAAGASQRMRGRDKLLEPVGGSSLLRDRAEMLLASAVDQVVCVLPSNASARGQALDDLDIQIATNPRADDGMGTSIAAGVRALPQVADAALIMLADMPDITTEDVDKLLSAFDPGEGRAIVRATAADRTPGQPVLFGRRFFEALRILEGDEGARAIVREHGEFVADVPLAEQRALLDLDTPEAWEDWRGRSQE